MTSTVELTGKALPGHLALFCSAHSINAKRPRSKPARLQKTKQEPGLKKGFFCHKLFSYSGYVFVKFFFSCTVKWYDLTVTMKSLVECSSYRFLNESNRAMGYFEGISSLCDSGLSGWYRFSGGAGDQMPESCVPKLRCGTHVPGWLNGSHPSVAAGVVQRQVCFTRNSHCCDWSTYISVRNCGGFFVYKLHPPPACSLRYCGNGGPSTQGADTFQTLYLTVKV